MPIPAAVVNESFSSCDVKDDLNLNMHGVWSSTVYRATSCAPVCATLELQLRLSKTYNVWT